MAQLLLLGTNFVNFMGRFVYVATGQGGVEAVAVTEMDEPQAVIGSDLHQLAYPEQYAAHEKRRPRADDRRSITARRTRSACRCAASTSTSPTATGGFKVFDIAQINQKGFSEKIVSAPVSPLGQHTNVKTRYATAVAAPSHAGGRSRRGMRLPENEEQPIHPLYGYIYIADREEGLVLSTAATLLDGNPSNNFLKRAGAFNPDGRAERRRQPRDRRQLRLHAGDRGLVIVDIVDTAAADDRRGDCGARDSAAHAPSRSSSAMPSSPTPTA